jgi:3-deoxy-7-phosphoheptulonate synthase
MNPWSPPATGGFSFLELVMHTDLTNLRTEPSSEPLPSPDELRHALPRSAAVATFVTQTRAQIAALLGGEDRRLLVIVGPCSIHDATAALHYAERLARVRDELSGELLICMRAYFEKPRTSVGWKGLVNDPHLDGSCDLAEGLRRSRGLLLELAAAGMPAASETLDPIVPHYLADLLSWTAIGARTTESQTHREMASGLSLPVGFKNGTDGGLDVAINGMHAARTPHTFIGIDGRGRAGVVRTLGNPHTHLVLRGGRGRPNYAQADVQAASERLRGASHNARVLIDCSHDNSGKNPENQAQVVAEIARQVEVGSPHVLGVMLESHLVAGRQELTSGRALTYGQSITDACLGFEATSELLYQLAAANRTARTRSDREHQAGGLRL